MLHAIVILLGFLPPVIQMDSGAVWDAPSPRQMQFKLDKQKASERGVLLKALSARLKAAQDANTSKVLADAIRNLWRASPSPTITLLMSRAGILVEKKEYETAIEILGAVSEIAPDYAQGWYQRANTLILMGEYGRALHDVGKVLEIEPEHFDALSRLGIILKELGDESGALNAFKKAYALYPQLPGLKQLIKTLNQKVNGQAI
ncbi:MAG TPA: hypothetical protein ENJ57_06860 [Rhizobiales bacterium]|nr:hypothetical protein [Hyphomicrobiales bacterium]